MNINNDGKSSYVVGIDGLRAIAILSVIIYHLNNKWLPGGFVGVDVFFVISGYVISKSLAGSHWANFKEFLLGFYKRRILRILPALLFCLIITSIVSTLFIPNNWLSSLNNDTALHAFTARSNIFLVNSEDGYFNARIPFNPFVHTWSLAVEEQFYLLFPFIFYIWLKKRNSSYGFLVVWILPFLTLLSLGKAVYQSSSFPDRAFYLLPSRFWELGIGSILFQLQANPNQKFKTLFTSQWVMLIGTLILIAGFMYADDKHFPFPWALLPVAGTLLLIAGTTSNPKNQYGIQRFIGSHTMVYLGLISYSLYLWHWPIFTLFRWTVGMSNLLTQVLATLFTFCIAAFSYHFIENAFRKNFFLKSQANRKIVIGGLGLIGVSFLFTSLLFKYSDALGLNLSVTANKYDWSPNYDIPTGFLNSTSVLKTRRHIFVIGDSHAHAYEVMIKMAAAKLGAETEIFTRAGCPMASLITAAKDDQQCLNFEQKTINRIKQQANQGDIVFLASLRVDRFGDQWALFDQNEVLLKSKLLSSIKERELALKQAIKLTEDLKAMGLNVLIDAPPPIFKAPPFRCSDWFNKYNPICTPGFSVNREVLLEHRKPTMASLRVLHDSYGVYIWDPFPVLCKGPICSAFDGDKPVFQDDDHLSGYGNRMLVPSFTNQLHEIWGES